MKYDNSGFLWVAGSKSEVFWGVYRESAAVLQRFDGKHFHTIDLPNTGPPIEYIIQITKYGDKFYLLCAGKKGNVLYIFDPYRINFQLVPFPEKTPKAFSHIFCYGDRYFILSNKDNALYEIKGARAIKITSLKIPENFEIDVATEFIPYGDFFLLSASFKGVHLFDWEGNLLKSKAGFYGKSEKNLKNAWIDGKVNYDGNFYFLFSRKPILYRFLPDKRKIVPAMDFREKIGDNNFRFWNDEKGNPFLAVESGKKMLLYKVSEKGLTLYKTLSSQGLSFRTRFYSTDISKSLWVANPGFEINHYRFYPQAFQRFLPKKSMRGLYPMENGNILAATEYSGLFEIDVEEGTAKPFPVYRHGKIHKLYSAHNIVPGKDSSTVWVNDQFGMLRIDLKTHHGDFWDTRASECMKRLNDTLLVSGTKMLDLMVFNTKTKKSRVLIPADSLWIMGLAVKGGNAYAATDKGLLVHAPASGTTNIYKTSPKPADSSFLCILKEKTGSFLLGTASGKVWRFCPRERKFGLVYEDSQQSPVGSLIYFGKNLWINTFDGFVSFNPKTGETKRFSAKDGFSSNEANRYSTLATEKGLFIGTVKGLTFFRPGKIVPQQSNCQLVPLSVELYDKKAKEYVRLSDREYLQTVDQVTLPVRHRSFQLEFGMKTCTLFLEAGFKYRLNNGQWISLGQEQSLRFENLEPGEYRLEVAAFGLSGNSIGKPILMNILVNDFFYNTGWFMTLVLLLLLLLCWAFYRNHIQKIKKEQRLRNKIATNLHDDVGGLLTGISMCAELLQIDEEVSKKDFGKKIALASKEAIRAMRDVVWSIDSYHDHWESVLLRLLDFGNRLFEDSKIDFHFDQSGIPPKKLSQEKRHAVYLICKESMHNAMKHSHAKEVSFSCRFSPAQACIIIADDGTGFEKQEKYVGQGMRNMAMRAKQIKAGFSIKNKSGTEVCLEVPLR